MTEPGYPVLDSSRRTASGTKDGLVAFMNEGATRKACEWTGPLASGPYDHPRFAAWFLLP